MAVAGEILTNWRCRRMQPRLVDYAAGSLAARRCSEVERHVAACAVCADALVALREVPVVLRERSGVDRGDQFWAQQQREIMRKVRQLPEPGRHAAWRPTLGWWGGVVASTAALLLVVGRVWMQPHGVTIEHMSGEVESLDPETVQALSDEMESLVPQSEFITAPVDFAEFSPRDGALAELSGFPEFGDDELEALAEMIGPAAG